MDLREWHVLASGASMSQQLADSLRGKQAIVVSNCYQLAPWAFALVSQDHAWWKQHPDALAFTGRKFSTNKGIDGVEHFDVSLTPSGTRFGTGCNSGLMACLVAQYLGANRICLHGFDLRGEHYFGQHKPPLKNPDDKRFAGMCREFDLWHRPDVEVVNMTPNSALHCFPAEPYVC